MQTPSITPAANPAPASARSQNAGSDNASATPFDQVLSQEVAQRKTPEARGPEGRQDKQAGPENRTRTDAPKPNGEARQAEGKPAGEEAVDEDAATATTEAAAAHASTDLLALVANIAQLQKTEGAATQPATTDAAAEGAEDALSGRKAASPFAAIQSALGARAQRAAQDKAEGTPVQGEHAPAGRADIGKAGNDALPVQAAANAQAAAAAGKAALAANEFSATLKDANQLLQPLQQSAASQVAQADPAQAAGERLAPRVGTPAWDQALGQKIVWMVNGEQQNASLTLNPPELGPLKVVLQVSNAQASATFVAAQPEVRQALEAAMPRLRDMLGDAGIQLGQATVDSGSPHQQHASERQAGRAFGPSGGGDAGEAAATVTGSRVLSGGGRGLVDTFA